MRCEHCGRNVPEHLIHTPTGEDFRGRPVCRWTASRAVKSRRIRPMAKKIRKIPGRIARGTAPNAIHRAEAERAKQREAEIRRIAGQGDKRPSPLNQGG